MAYVVFKVLPATFKAGEEVASTDEMGWLGMCPVVATEEEALRLVGGREELILEILSPSNKAVYDQWREAN